MNKLLNSIFLISGTAIGSGLIALPLAAANIGIFASSIIVFLSFFVAYQTSIMTVGLINESKKYISIVELSQEFSGKSAFYISMASLYILSFSLLSVYFAGTSSIIGYFSQFNNFITVTITALIFFGLFSLKMRSFNKMNSVLFLILLISITIIIFNTYELKYAFSIPKSKITCSGIFYFIPIIFTSFGVQNVCPYICKELNMDIKKIKKAFLIGTFIPAVIYILWIYTILQSLYSVDRVFFERILQLDVDVGELIAKICETTKFGFINISFKVLTLFAIATSAIGIGIGLMYSLKENSSYCVKKNYTFGNSSNSGNFNASNS